MTKPIAAKYIDRKIQSIRENVSKKSDDRPFLLLPVRIETRFMKTQQIDLVYNAGDLERILGLVSTIDLNLTHRIPSTNRTKIRNHFRKVVRDMERATALIKKLPPITRKQKQWIQGYSNDIVPGVDAALPLLNTTFMSSVRKGLVENVRNLATAVQQIEITRDWRYDGIRSVTDDLKALTNKVKHINEGKLPYTSAGNKRQLYSYLEKTVEDIQYFYRQNDDKLDHVKKVAPEQISAIQRMHGQLRDELRKMSGTLREVHFDASWQKFVNRIHRATNPELAPGMLHFEQKMIPRLTFLSHLSSTNSDELYYEGLQTFKALQAFNNEGFATYFNVKKSRRKLDKKIKRLQQLTSQTIEGDSRQVNQFKALWKDIQGAMGTYQKGIRKAPIKNKSQQFGLKYTTDLIKDSTRNALRPMVKKATSKLQFIDSQVLYNSAGFHQNATVELLQLSANIEQNAPTADNIQTYYQHIQHIANDFKVASRNEVIMSEEDYDLMQGRILQARKMVETLQDQDQESYDFQGVLKDIEASFGTVKVIPKTVDELLNFDPVFTLPTKTVDQLWLRVFPDDIFVDTHEEALTQKEVDAGKEFWTTYWTASTDNDLELGAWRKVHALFGPQRAAWVVRTLDPRPSNSSLFDRNNRPYEPLIQAIGFLKQIHEDIAHLNDESDIITDVLEGLNERNMVGAMAKVKSITNRQRSGWDYLLQKVSDHLHSLHSPLGVVIKNLRTLTDAQQQTFRTKLNRWRRILRDYGSTITNFRKIKPLTGPQVHAAFAESIDFKEPEQGITLKEEDWTVQPSSKVMPEQFVVLTMTGDQFNHIVVGKPVPQPLPLGLDPQHFDADDDVLEKIYDFENPKNLSKDIRWLVDFDEAVSIGMGFKIDLTKKEAEKGFDKILVLGIKEAANAKELVEELFKNHRFAEDGMSILNIGAPTNNTSEEPADFKKLEDDAQLSMDLALGKPRFTGSESDKRDGERLADALGIDRSYLQRIQNAGGQQISNAFHMHKALWHATMGNYMEEAFDSIFTYDNIERTRKYFCENVSARGILPSLRIGSQPYGILPTTAFSQMRMSRRYDIDNLPNVTKNQLTRSTLSASTNRKLQTRFDIRMWDLFQKMNGFWSEVRAEQVKHVHNVKDNDPQQHFLGILGLQASSVEHYYRYGINIASRSKDDSNIPYHVNFERDQDFSPWSLFGMFDENIQQGIYHGAFDFTDEDMPSGQQQRVSKILRTLNQVINAGLFNWRFWEEGFKLSNKLVSSKPLSAKNTLENLKDENQSYISWMLNHNLFELMGSNQPGQIKSSKVLFLLLRQSLLLAYREAALEIFEKENFFNEEYRKKLGSKDLYRIVDGQANEFTFATKWTYLFRELKALHELDFQNYSSRTFYKFMDQQNADHLSMAEYFLRPQGIAIQNSYPHFNSRHKPFLDRVEEVRASIEKLDAIPTKALDQLLREHFDLCSYRLDAWITGQANRRLSAQRKKKPKGLYLGAFGWVEDLRPGGTRTQATEVPDALYKRGDKIYTDQDNQGFIHAPSINQAITAAVLRSGYRANTLIEDVDNVMAVNLSSRRVRKALQLVESIKNGLDVGAVLGFQLERGLHESYKTVEMDRYILPLRQAYPLNIPVTESTATSGEVIYTNVINGQKILDEIDATIEAHSLPVHQSINDIIRANNYRHLPDQIFEIITGTTQRNINYNLDNRRKKLDVICREIDNMFDSFDALGDLAISESVYQVAQGNYERAGSMVKALAEGKAPSEIQIIQTPRTGTIVNQRVVLNIERKVTAKPPQWTMPLTVRAAAEPSLNFWLGKMMGDPDDIRCWVHYGDADSPTTKEVKLSDLNLHPVDVLHLLGSNPEQGGSELNRRVAWWVRDEDNLPTETAIHLHFTDRLESWSEGIRSFYEMEPLFVQLKQLMADARPASALDLKEPAENPEVDNPGKQDLNGFRNRVLNAKNDLDGLYQTVKAWFDNIDKKHPAFTDARISELKTFLWIAADYGIGEAIPDSFQGIAINANTSLFSQAVTALNDVNDLVISDPSPNILPRPLSELVALMDEALAQMSGVTAGSPALSDVQIQAMVAALKMADEFGIASAAPVERGLYKDAMKALHRQSAAVLKKIGQRLNPVSGLEDKLDEEVPAIRKIEILTEISQHVFGKSFIMMPSYVPDNKTDIQTQLSLPNAAHLLRYQAHPMMMDDWLDGVADVRPKMYAWQMSQTLGEIFGENTEELAPVQFPYEAGDHWVGREFPAGYVPGGDKLSLVLLNASELTEGSDNTKKMGLVIDEWVEILPNKQETSGIAMHYDQPNATPPQTLLLAVSPDETGKWAWDDLVYTLLDTLELAKNRAVEPEHLEQSKMAQVMPALIAEAVLPPPLLVLDAVYTNFVASQVVLNYGWNQEDE